MPIATFPSKYINPESGTILLKVYNAIAPTSAHFLTLGQFKISYAEGVFSLFHDNQPLSVSKVLEDGFTTFVWTWENHTHRFMIQDKTGFTEILSPANWANMESQLFTFVGDPLFSGEFVILETHVTSLLPYPEEIFSDETALFLNSVSLGAINESISSPINHPFVDYLPQGGMLFGRDFRESNIRYLQKPYLEATPAPNDSSPILVSDEKGMLRRQYFFDFENGNYTDTNIESFTYRGEDSFRLSYNGLDEDYPPIITIGGELIPLLYTSDYTVHFSLTEQEKERWYGQIMTIQYRLDRAYHIEWNENAAHDSYIIQLSDRESVPVTVTQEGNRHHSVKLATEIELNPLVSPQHTGFLYIDKEKQIGKSFKMSLSNPYVVLDGMDSADITIELIDQNGNEILSPHIDVFIADRQTALRSDYGTISPIITEDTLDARNRAGRCYFRYRAPLFEPNQIMEPELFIVCYDRESGLGAQIPLRLKRPTNELANSVVFSYAQEGLSEASLPFEYFARFYGKKIPLGHPILECDFDNDGILTRQDWLSFQKELQNQSFMKPLTERLREQEAF